ncbi:MAG: tRNA-dihydrouridine synthase family protein [Lachnospiraceae bacterium]|jgi:tRNA-dihydrouridine synthase|uniref:tRNA dihydrouridine synthase n=1 Tax=Clostridia TaxID=186801 RepID=UPI000E4D4D66|nr:MULTISPECIES: tRNA-dihydrouridine synthase family protein [Clostridia]MBS5190768.1 tRNA-dihydrouridine synthase family protein [Lachnospiraceae bacterium]RHV65313.1 tRNA-dihydrouridine synthase family protein [Roseburia sp. OM02-15]
MNLYFAPLEGIGGYIYRNAQADYFEKADKYYSPFLAPNQNRSISPKEYKDIAPEHNEDITLVPQIMANNAEIFLKAAQELEQLGYKEINLNLGCPSRTVVTKYRGAGFLAKPDALEQFLEEVYSKLNIRLSLKTRLGMEDEEEFEHLLDIYNKFPVSELIIHPRVQTDYYKNTPRMESFLNALEKSKNPVVYNGDIFNKEKYQQVMKQMDVSGVMLGRGVLANPALFGEIRGTEKLSKERLWEFHERLLADYTQEMSGERNVLFKMKELWFYLAWSFTNTEKYEKKIRKAQHLSDYRLVVKQLFFEQELR